MSARAWAAAIAAAALSAIISGCVATGYQATAVPAPRQSCPSVVTVARCVITPAGGTGEQDVAAAGAQPGTPWMVTDPNDAPMAWVNLYGMYSGGDGGKMPGGDLCVTYGTAAVVACLTPEGDLTLQRTGPGGPHGPVETLTARDIAFLHSLEKKAGQ